MKTYTKPHRDSADKAAQIIRAMAEITALTLFGMFIFVFWILT